MPSCSVLFCDKKTKSDKNRRIFNLPKDPELVEKWKEVLQPYLKSAITQNIRICNLHFDPKDIETTFCHNVDGRQIIIERERARLLPNAIPDRNFPSNAELMEKQKSPGRGRKPRKKKLEISNDESLQEENDEKPTNIIDTSLASKIFEKIISFKESDLPSSLWAIHRCPENSKIVFSYMDITKMTVSKMICIDSDLTTTIYMDGQAVSTDTFDVHSQNVMESISHLVDLIDQT